ncbi:MAG: hypothetical protein JWM26_910, partial [Betaproteobacteria bacterium]|nr:hypothetical protein [Betaproteobacteria bacterium]
MADGHGLIEALSQGRSRSSPPSYPWLMAMASL